MQQHHSWIQCFQKGPHVRTWSICIINRWNDLHFKMFHFLHCKAFDLQVRQARFHVWKHCSFAPRIFVSSPIMIITAEIRYLPSAIHLPYFNRKARRPFKLWFIFRAEGLSIISKITSANTPPLVTGFQKFGLKTCFRIHMLGLFKKNTTIILF